MGRARGRPSSPLPRERNSPRRGRVLMPFAVIHRGRLVSGSHRPSPSKRPGRRGTARQRVWDARRWRRIALAVKQRDGFACCRCGWRDETMTGAGLVADHVVPVEELVALGRDPFDPAECQTLCLSCSGSKDGRLPRVESRAVQRGGVSSAARGPGGPAPKAPRETSTMTERHSAISVSIAQRLRAYCVRGSRPPGTPRRRRAARSARS